MRATGGSTDWDSEGRGGEGGEDENGEGSEAHVWRAGGGIAGGSCLAGMGLRAFITFGKRRRQVQHAWEIWDKSHIRRAVTPKPKTRNKLWCKIPRHTSGSPSGPQSVSQSSSGMRPISFSGSAISHSSCFLALTPVPHSPRSMLGGDLHWIWTGYEIYQEVDYVCPLHFARGACHRPPE